MVLLRPTDDFPKPFLLSRLMPVLARLLVTRNNGISPAENARIMRLRAVVHTGTCTSTATAPSARISTSHADCSMRCG